MFLGLDPSPIRLDAFENALAPVRRLASGDFSDDHAFDGELDLVLVRTLELPRNLEPDFSLDRDLSLHSTLALTIALARAIDKILAPKRNSRQSAASFNYVGSLARLARALVRALLRATEIAGVVNPTLARRLKAPGVEAPTQVPTIRWRRKWPLWHAKLHELMLTHDISHGCMLTQDQEGILVAYQRANLLLVECMNAANGLTNKTRQSIEDSILLPWTEVFSQS